eukprot:3591288-Pyramimonas_sp.AAC.1
MMPSVRCCLSRAGSPHIGIPTLTPTHSDPPPTTGKFGNEKYGLGTPTSPASTAHRPRDRSTSHTAPRTPTRNTWVMKPLPRTVFALLTLTLSHEH